MSLRIFKIARFGLPLAMALGLSACSESPVAERQGDSAQGDSTAAAKPAADTIPCALNGATEMKAVCKHSVVVSGESSQLLLEGPEGDFRRFTILSDGRGLEPADGAETAAIKLLDGDKIEVTVGDDIFVLPAKVKPSVAEALPAAAATTPPAAEPAANAPAGQPAAAPAANQP